MNQERHAAQSRARRALLARACVGLGALAALTPASLPAKPLDARILEALLERLHISAVADSSSAAPDVPQGPAWIEVDEPQSSEVVRPPVGWVEMRGRIGGRNRGYDDVVIAVDRSQSTLLPTGLDIDRDGVTAAMVDPNWQPALAEPGSFRTWTTDFDDVVLNASLVGLRALLGAMDPERTRVGVVAFSGQAQVLAPLGSVSEALTALERVRFEEDDTGSDLSAAVQQGLWLLDNREPKSRPAQRAIILVSDGLPTQPRNESYAARRAREQARRAKAAGVQLYTFEMAHLEDSERNDSEVLADMAVISGGAWRRVDRPLGLRWELPHRSGGGVKRVEIQNQTTGQRARAVRIFPNGNFDAFVPLKPGENRFLIRTRLADGREATLEHVLEYAPGPEDERKAKRLLDELRSRTRETENWRQPRRQRGVTITPEGPTTPAAPPATPPTDR